MKKNRYTQEKIAYAFKLAEPVTAVPKVFRKQGARSKRFNTGAANIPIRQMLYIS